ncbi:MAG: archease [Gemmatimonadota bacterium]
MSDAAGGAHTAGDGDGWLGPGVAEIAHTADLGIEVEAEDRAELFRRAAQALFRLRSGTQAADRAAHGVPLRFEVEVSADEPPVLLVRWLAELLYLAEAQHFELGSTEFHTLDDLRLVATVHGWRSAFDPVRELKGVTYHGLELRHFEGRWWARVIFDI